LRVGSFRFHSWNAVYGVGFVRTVFSVPVPRFRALLIGAGLFAVAALAGCGGGGHPHTAPIVRHARVWRVPPLLDPSNVYAADAAGRLSHVVRRDPALVYVPNSLSNTVDVISQRTLRIIRRFQVKQRPQHVVPSYDLNTLFVTSDLGNSLQPINPRTGKRHGPPLPVADPQNLYFPPDAHSALPPFRADCSFRRARGSRCISESNYRRA
jgi:hypothetical protein